MMERVLIVDVDKYLTLALQRVLQQEKFAVTAVTSAREAKSAVTREAFDLIVTSMRRSLDAVSGFIALVNRLAPAVPIIAITGRDASKAEAMIVSGELKVARVFKEPLDFSRFIGAVEGLVGRPSPVPIQPRERPAGPNAAYARQSSFAHRSAGASATPRKRRKAAVAGVFLAAAAAAGLIYMFTAGPRQKPAAPMASVAVSHVPAATAATSPAQIQKTDATAEKPVKPLFDTLPSKTVLELHGSNTIGAKLAPALAKAFLKQQFNTDDVRIVKPSGPQETLVQGLGAKSVYVIRIQAHGSSTGFKGLLAGQCDIGMSSRRIKPGEIAKLKHLGAMTAVSNEHVLALDGIAVIVHPSNPISHLNIGQIRAIFTGRISDWSQLGLTVGPIRVYARDDNSGTYDTFKGLVLGKTPLVGDAERYESNQKLSDDVAADPLGIGFTGLPYINKSKAVAVADTNASAIFPTFFTVATEDYALARRLFLYSPANPSNPYASEFVHFALSSGGQTVVAEIGFVDMNIKSFSPPWKEDEPYQNSAVINGYRRMIENAMRLSLNFRFQRDKALLDNRGIRDIDRLVVYLKNNMQKKIKLIGFADSTGDYFYNRDLAQVRADTVRDELFARGLNVDKTFSAGEELPVASNSTSLGRERNRRVEVWIQ